MLAIALLAGCGPKLPVATAGRPLPGRIWNVAETRWETEEDLVEALQEVDFVLLGENHDNLEHHRLQARLITAIEPFYVGFEMLDHQDPVEDAPDPKSLAEAVGWAESGWPSFTMYEGVFQAAYAVEARIVPAHPTRAEVVAVMDGGFEALAPEDRSGLALDRELPKEEREELVAELLASHPGEVSPEVVDKMVRAQILKDLWMARALAMAGSPAVLIAGGGHTRTDRGVPRYLDGVVRVVRFVEVDGEPDRGAMDDTADWLWFTPP